MNEEQALNVISALANGVNPITRELLDAGSPCQSTDVIRALYVAIRALEMANRSRARRDRVRLPAKAGKPWTEQEDRNLLEQFDSGVSLAQLAESHERTLAGIQARLERHGRVQGQGTQWRRRDAAALSGGTGGERSEG